MRIAFWIMIFVRVVPEVTFCDSNVGRERSVVDFIQQSRRIELEGNLTESSDQLVNMTQSVKPLELLIAEKQGCQQGFLTSCLKYKLFKFVDDLARPVSQLSTSDWNQIARSFDDHKFSPRLVGLPIRVENISLNLFGGGKDFGRIFQFFEAQLARFLNLHGLLFPVESLSDDDSDEIFRKPILLESGREGRESRAKVKRKSVVFPLLVLFKFFKIKMLLVPILLSVLFIKKLLIFTLALAPSLFGFFRFCRPSGFGPTFGFGPAGLIQDLGDVRGEFSSSHPSYTLPYKDMYRHRDNRYTADSMRPIDSNNVSDY